MNTLRRLVVFQKGRHNAGQRQGRTIERVREVNFAICIAVSAVHQVLLTGGGASGDMRGDSFLMRPALMLPLL